MAAAVVTAVFTAATAAAIIVTARSLPSAPWSPPRTTAALARGRPWGLSVIDTMTFSNGKLWKRAMTAQLIATNRWRVSAEDMLGGSERTVTPHGFTFTPFKIFVPIIGPLQVPIRCTDEIELVDARTMLDTSEMWILGVRIGKMVMRLEQE